MCTSSAVAVIKGRTCPYVIEKHHDTDQELAGISWDLNRQGDDQCIEIDSLASYF